MIAFFDASALIYLVEGRQPFSRKVRDELAETAGRHADLRSGLIWSGWN